MHGTRPRSSTWRAIRDELERGVEPKAVYERLKAELPELEERVAGEEACYTFDWYDDHHYEKIYSGRLMACPGSSGTLRAVKAAATHVM